MFISHSTFSIPKSIAASNPEKSILMPFASIVSNTTSSYGSSRVCLNSPFARVLELVMETYPICVFFDLLPAPPLRSGSKPDK
jgi:hypothetical protein